MVCRYMIDRMKFDPQEAINAFNEARGHDIERDNYLIDLLNSNKSPEERIIVENASDGEIIEDEDEDEDDDSDLDEPATLVKPDLINQPVAPPVIPDKVPSFPPGDAPNFGPPSNFQGNILNDFRGRGFQRRPHGNRGFQNSFNRGGGGGFNHNFDNRRSFRSRNRGGGGNFRGNFRGGWKDQKPSYYDYDDDDLDDDTEVIITATERGTIIREERSISEHRRKLAEFQGHGRGAQQPKNTSVRRAHEEDDSYRATRIGRDRLGHSRFDDDWEVDDEPRKKHWKADDAFSERDSFRKDSWKGRGPFEGEALGKGHGAFEGRGRGTMESTTGGRGRGVQYPESHDWGYKGRGYRDNTPSNRSRYYDDDDDDDAGDNYFKKYSKGFGANERSRRSWSPDGRKGYRAGGDARFRGQGQAEGFRDPVEGRGGYNGRGRGRDKSPPEIEREVSPLGYRSRTREPGYGDVEQGSVYRGEGPGRFKDTPAFSRFREESSSDFFGKKSRSAFRDDGPSGFRRNMGSGGFRSESPLAFDGERAVGGKKLGSYDDGFRKQKYQGRAAGQQDSFTRDSFRDDGDDDTGMSTTRRRHMTPPAQYRDLEPDDNEDSPPFCDDSPPFTGSGDGLGARDSSFRGRGHDDCFRGRGRAFARGSF